MKNTDTDHTPVDEPGCHTGPNPLLKVIYVMGLARSGSTILDLLLGQHPQVTSMGEIVHIIENKERTGEVCGCGTPIASCSYWRKVRGELVRNGGDLACRRLLATMPENERIRAIPRIFLRSLRGGVEQSSGYAQDTVTVLRAMASTSGTPVLVDSSKSPGRGLALRDIQGLDVRLIHLVRDPRGVATSLAKPWQRDIRRGIQNDIAGQAPAASARLWLAVNLASEMVAQRFPSQNRVRIRYEDLVGSTCETLRQIGKVSGLDLSGLEKFADGTRPPRPNHVLAGNRSRLAGTLRLRVDERWRQDLPVRDRRMVERITLPLRLAYGYE